MTGSGRIAAAVALFDPQPGQHILEIGCGAGLGIAALLARQPDIRVTAIDRSEVALMHASRRNAAAIEDGRVRLLCADIEACPVPHGPFDRMLAIRVNSFWTRPGVALRNLSAWLRPGGNLWMVYDLPEAKVIGPIEASLAAFGLPNPERRSSEGAFAIVARF